MGSEEEGPVAWLRAAIEARKAVAEAAAPGPWQLENSDRDPYWNGRSWEFGPDASARRNVMRHWRVKGPRVGIESAGNDAYFVPDLEFIVLNDPQDTIARCEAELAILDQHEPVIPVSLEQEAREWQECRECGPNNNYPEIYAVPGKGEAFYPCQTVRLLAGGYKHRPGFPASLAAN
jgi:Family of unknown function (DUF6221)